MHYGVSVKSDSKGTGVKAKGHVRACVSAAATVPTRNVVITQTSDTRHDARCKMQASSSVAVQASPLIQLLN